MRAIVKGFLENAHVRFNGDEDAVTKYKEDQDKLEEKKREFAELNDSFEDSELSSVEVERFEKLPQEIKTLEDGDNTLILTLVHPGENGNVNVMKPIRIGNGIDQGYVGESDDFLDAGLFKVVTIGEFGIRAAITDTDQANPFTLFLRRVVSGAFNTATKSFIGDIGNVLVSSAASQLSSDIGDSMRGETGSTTTIIGVSPVAKFIVNGNGLLSMSNPSAQLRYSRNELTLPLSFPGLVKTGENKYAKPGSANGAVVIRLESELVA